MHGATAVGRRSGDRVVLPPTQYDKPANYAEVALRQHGDSEDEDGDEGGGTVLRSVALDDVPELQPPQRCPAVLKVDVETMELAVLAGAAQLLARCSAVTALYLETSGAEAELAARCAAHGYDRVFHHDFSDNFYTEDDDAARLARGEGGGGGAPRARLVMARSMNLLCVSSEALLSQGARGGAMRAVLAAHRAKGMLREFGEAP